MARDDDNDNATSPSRDGLADRRRVLVVEDMMLQALSLAAVLEEAGFDVVGPAFDANEARELALAQPPDLAILDVNLGVSDITGGETIAETLLRLDVPFIFLSAYDRSHLATQLQAYPHVKKPYETAALLRVVAANLPARASGA